ncbi:MAG: hypothetical protein L6R36_008535, partial [Xanthoria steineri]
MHFSTPVVLSSLFSLSLALPQLPKPEGQPTGRLLVSYYNEPTFRTFGMKSGASSSGGKGSPVLKESKPFTIKAFNSESPEIHMMDIVASNGKFFIGNMTGSTCPENVQDCPTGNVTALQTTDTGRVYLDVVNKTQAVYVDLFSRLRFNPPAVKVMRKNAQNATFSLTQNPIPAPPAYSALVFSGVGRSTGYLACPVEKATGPFQVFVATGRLIEEGDSWVPGGDVSDCIGFDAFATDYTSPVPAAY